MFLLTTIKNTDFSRLIEGVKEAIRSFGTKENLIRNLIEIIILSVLLFFTVRLLRGKKAGALAMGIGVLLVFLILSDICGFTVLYKLFNSILGSGIIVVIIIFQPEIRDALEKIGSGSLKGIMSFSDRRKKKEQYKNAIDQICTAVSLMAAEYTGALIVIERTISLSNITRDGVVIDANVHESLIRNIFYNKSPLHDGAIVISGDKIISAACFLPLTEREDVDSALGTRHRAALGIAEKSDAIVIIVSEETGAISIAYDFTLEKNVTKQHLESFLLENVLRLSCNNDTTEK